MKLLMSLSSGRFSSWTRIAVFVLGLALTSNMRKGKTSCYLGFVSSKQQEWRNLLRYRLRAFRMFPKSLSNRGFYLLVIATVLAVLVIAMKQYTTVNMVQETRWQLEPKSRESPVTSNTRFDNASTGTSPRRALYNYTLQELTVMLNNRLSQPNDAPEIVYSRSCADIQNLEGCTDKTCPRPLNSNPQIRLKELMSSPQLKLSDDQRDTILSISESIPENDIIFVSASSANHFDEMQAMFQDVHTVVQPNVPNSSFVLFDIGLTEQQRAITEKHCRCQVIVFPKEKFPKHVSDNHCYSWKPLIILATIARARKILVWQDSSIRWTNKIQVMLDRAEKYGQQIIRYKVSSRIPGNTLKQTFDYMGENSCAFMPYPEIQSSVHIHKRDPLVIQTLLEPWARCALEASCMCPVKNPGSVLSCNKNLKIHRCHRFDQSALSMLLAKLYGEDMFRILAPEFAFHEPQYVAIKRGTKLTNYFKSL